MTVAVGVVHPGSVSSHFAFSLARMVAYDDRMLLHPIGSIIEERSGPLIARARNRVVERFLSGSAEWLCFIDADMAFEPNALDQVLSVADAGSCPIVGGLCFGTVDGRLAPTIFDWIELRNEPVLVRCGEYPHDRIVQVAATGAAFLLIHRSVLVAVRDAKFSKAYPWFQEVERDGEACGEDVTFCLRAGELGFPVLVDTRIKTSHDKSVLLNEAVYDSQGGDQWR